MTEPPSPRRPATTGKKARAERVAAALRENLRKRKEQARQRKEGAAAAPHKGSNLT